MLKIIFILYAGLLLMFPAGAAAQGGGDLGKHFVKDSSEAPLPVDYKVSQVKKGDAIILSWDEVMKAADYKLQIASDKNFAAIVLETLLARNKYEVYPAFFAGGVYYWRISGLLTLNTGARREGRFSDAHSFAVTKRVSAAAGVPLAAPVLPGSMVLNGKKPSGWKANPVFRYYRMQLSETKDFSDPSLDTFTDKEFYKLSGLSVEYGKPYFMRLMGSDGVSGGTWSEASEVTFASLPAIHARGRRF